METIRFFGCRSRRITSKTVVFLTDLACSMLSPVKGVYDVIRKCVGGVGMREAIIPTRSLCLYPGYRSVVVEADITVET
jgi:hypothetical protein